jgi:hypothetical protein
MKDATKLLDQTLAEEKKTDEALTRLADTAVNAEAAWRKIEEIHHEMRVSLTTLSVFFLSTAALAQPVTAKLIAGGQSDWAELYARIASRLRPPGIGGSKTARPLRISRNIWRQARLATRRNWSRAKAPAFAKVLKESAPIATPKTIFTSIRLPARSAAAEGRVRAWHRSKRGIATGKLS